MTQGRGEDKTWAGVCPPDRHGDWREPKQINPLGQNPAREDLAGWTFPSTLLLKIYRRSTDSSYVICSRECLNKQKKEHFRLGMVTNEDMKVIGLPVSLPDKGVLRNILKLSLNLFPEPVSWLQLRTFRVHPLLCKVRLDVKPLILFFRSLVSSCVQIHFELTKILHCLCRQPWLKIPLCSTKLVQVRLVFPSNHFIHVCCGNPSFTKKHLLKLLWQGKHPNIKAMSLQAVFEAINEICNL